MVGLFLLSLLTLSAADQPPAQGERGIAVKSAKDAGVSSYDPKRMHAIVIGIDAYTDWPKLRCAAKDAHAVASTLHRIYGFPTNQINLILDSQATRKNLLAAFDAGCRLTEEDNLVIYYAGHGWMDDVKNGYWIPVDARENDKFDYISNNQVVGDSFKKYRVKHLLVVADSCFSGAMLRGLSFERGTGWKLPAGFEKPSRLVMTSADLEPAPDEEGGHSPFAHRFLQYLEHGDQKAFGVQDLYVFVRKNLNTKCICAPLDTPAHMPGGELALCRIDKPLPPVAFELPRQTPQQSPSRQTPLPARTEVLRNSLGMEFVPIGGLDGVLFSRWETRVRDFDAFASALGREPEEMESVDADGWGNRQRTWKDPGFKQNLSDPVAGVSWGDAVAFCAWLTRKETAAGTLNGKQHYRLPTDREWSVAAGLDDEVGQTPEDRNGKKKDVFPWGKEWPPPERWGNFAGEEVLGADWPGEWGRIAGYADGFARTSPVGTFPANKFGLFDMSGNVQEWCADSMSPSNLAKVLRGGSWCSGKPGELLTSYRHADTVNRRVAKYGFRCVLDLAASRP